MTDQPLDLDQIETRARELMRVSGLDYDQVAARLAQTDVPAMADAIHRLRAERDRYRGAWQSARERAQAYGEGIERVVKDRESYQGWLKQAEARVAEMEEERRLEWLLPQGVTPHTPRLCACGHSHYAHTVPAPHSCFAHGQTCPCPAYRQLPHDEAMAQLERNRQAAAEREGASRP